MAAQADVSSPSIADLIKLTLAGVVGVAGCGPDTTTTSDDVNDDSYATCGERTLDPFDVSAWNLTPERIMGLYAQTVAVWDELDDQHKCELACAYAGQELDAYARTYYYEYLEVDSCALTLVVEQEVITGGSVTCAANVVTTVTCLGRRPLGWTEQPGASGDQLTHMVILEHASVTAFMELASQLEELGAPAQLIARCLASAQDEREHVELLVGLGAVRPGELPAASGPGTSRLTIALHNATEGCVAETWAALLARYQAEHATDEATRRTFAQIAEDEGRHAQLAWDLHGWLSAGLSAAEAAAIEAARAEALAALGSTALTQALMVAARDRSALGLPDPRTARALAQRFAQHLAARAAAA